MRPSVDELQSFYRSRQGQLARRLITTQLRLLWPDVHGLTVVGIGFPSVFLPVFDEARSTAALFTGIEAPDRWPADEAGRSALTTEEELPLADASADRVLLVHAVENTTQLQRLLREVWRIMADGGRLVAIVPNRRGFWCWNDQTPFGYGQPYSTGQLGRSLTQHLFEPLREGGALYLPPALAENWPRLAIPAERLGLRFLKGISGVVMIEAQKSVLAARPVAAVRTRIRRYAPLQPAAMARTTSLATEKRSAGHPAPGRGSAPRPKDPAMGSTGRPEAREHSRPSTQRSEAELSPSI